MRHPEIVEVAAHLSALAAEMLGADAVPFRATFFDKSPASNWLVPWHQDTALPMAKRPDPEAAGWGPWSIKEGIHYAHAPAWALERVVAVRLHLDPSTADNGPLRVLPGTHHLGVLTDDEVAQLAHRSVGVSCLASSGGVLLMRPLLIHSSAKVVNGLPRRVLHIEYATTRELAPGLRLAVT